MNIIWLKCKELKQSKNCWMPTIWYKIKFVFPHEHWVNHRNTENKAERDIIRSVSPPFFLKAKIDYSKQNRTWKLTFILMCRCLSLFFMLWWQTKKKQNWLNHILKQQQIKYIPLVWNFHAKSFKLLQWSVRDVQKMRNTHIAKEMTLWNEWFVRCCEYKQTWILHRSSQKSLQWLINLKLRKAFLSERQK